VNRRLSVPCEKREVPLDVAQALDDLNDWCVDTRTGERKILGRILTDSLTRLYRAGDIGMAQRAYSLLWSALGSGGRGYTADHCTECNKAFDPVVECLIDAVERDFGNEMQRQGRPR